ncbi:ABC transporter ATP-binding protein [Dorea ammoniilytica]
MIEIRQLQKNYQDFHLDCSLRVEDGMITGLAGKNGSGKSTTFKAILGLIRADGGEVEVFGKKVADLGKKDREQMGVVLSDSGISEYLTVEDLIPVMKNLYTKFDEKSFRERCERFNLPCHKKIKDFSTGMKRKLQINLALSHEAKLLILDEPTAGLDVSAREELLDMLREYMEPGDRSILISSHIATDLEGFCDDIYLINDGKIVLHEDTDVLLGKYGVLKVTEEQYWKIDRKYMVAVRKEEYGYRCLTNEKQFYLENYPDIVIEKSGIDELILMEKKEK